MRWAFLALLAATLALRWWLSIRQERHVLRHRSAVPEPFRIPLTAHQKAADYTIARVRLGRVSMLVDAGLLLAFTFGGGWRWLAGAIGTGTMARGTLFLVVAFAASDVARLPLRIWSTFFIERKFGFNRTTLSTFVLDLAKQAALGLAIGGPLAWGALFLATRGWWVQLWAGWLAVSIFFAWAWPAWIAPLFWRFRPLADRSLAARLEDLLRRTGFESGGLFEMDGSRRSRKANAFFSGFGRRKRVVLFDTLIDLMTPSEIEAVVAHELGHFKLRHIAKGLLVGAAVGALSLAGLAASLSWSAFHEELNVPHSTAPGLVLFAFVAPLLLLPLRPLLAFLSRKHEYEADAFAVREVGAVPMAAALVKLYEHNATTLTPDALHSAFHDSHPPAPLRIGKISDPG